MKRLFFLVIFISVSIICLAQTEEQQYVPGTVMPADNYITSERRNDDILIQNFENAFTNKNVDQIDAFLTSVVTMRLDDKLYINIPSSEAIDLLDKYLKDKKDIVFRRTTGKSAKLIYMENDKKRMVYADFVFDGSGQRINAINLSNHPSATAFLR